MFFHILELNYFCAGLLQRLDLDFFPIVSAF